ncbi:RNA polymerase sigma-70 factor [uncultured Sunxiuqinia sp.]|uniref:RNA polymerase sigma-70 factor n=1 Tax=uncultured Sunxiuqinia sp. TaxID=1573825 RepID=UPI002AA837A2|nr:RNA polymerase sigma-70 factor [uncultured Sunxiuqinia sp.]
MNKGDINAFNKLFDLYSSKLYHFSLGYLKSREDSEEVVQDIFCKLWDNRKLIKENHDFKAYLFTIAFNYIKKHFRSKAVINRYMDYTSGTQKSFMEDDVNYPSLKSLVDDLVEKMPEKRRAVFIKSRFEGKSNSDISEELNISKSTVENHLNLALRFLRDNIEKENLTMALFFSLFIQ